MYVKVKLQLAGLNAKKSEKREVWFWNVVIDKHNDDEVMTSEARKLCSAERYKPVANFTAFYTYIKFIVHSEN